MLRMKFPLKLYKKVLARAFRVTQTIREPCFSYMFMYSLREGTYAWKHLADDIPEELKKRRLNEIIALQGEIALENNRKEVGREYEVLVEGVSHRSKEQLFGRNSQNKVIVFDRGTAEPGTYRRVKVSSCTQATLLGELVDNK